LVESILEEYLLTKKSSIEYYRQKCPLFGK
jgi:hypothetical protein